MEAKTRPTHDVFAEGEGLALGEGEGVGLGLDGDVPVEGDGSALDERAPLQPAAITATTAASAGMRARTGP